MCLHAAYMGPDLLLHKRLEKGPNALLKQSWASEELEGARLNADGFGVGRRGLRTQPFEHGRLLCLHNGRIENFNAGPRAALHRYLSADIASQVEGNSDSEYPFALCKQNLLAGVRLVALEHVPYLVATLRVGMRYIGTLRV